MAKLAEYVKHDLTKITAGTVLTVREHPYRDMGLMKKWKLGEQWEVVSMREHFCEPGENDGSGVCSVGSNVFVKLKGYSSEVSGYWFEPVV